MELNAPSQGHDIVVIGGSAGGLEAVLRIVSSLPAHLPAAMFVVLHSGPNSPGVLPALLNRSGLLHAQAALDREQIEIGHIYVAPPDHHILVKRGYLRVTRGPKENGFRPAVDPLFRTAAVAYGPRVIGVILSGGLDDGTHGLSVIKQMGGLALAQDPQEALVPSMPLSAFRNVEVDHILRVGEAAELLTELVASPAGPWPEATKDLSMSFPLDPDDRARPDIAEQGSDALDDNIYRTTPSKFTCPECGGALWE